MRSLIEKGLKPASNNAFKSCNSHRCLFERVASLGTHTTLCNFIVFKTGLTFNIFLAYFLYLRNVTVFFNLSYLFCRLLIKVVECSIIYDNAEIKVLSLRALTLGLRLGFFSCHFLALWASNVPHKLKTFLYVVAS